MALYGTRIKEFIDEEDFLHEDYLVPFSSFLKFVIWSWQTNNSRWPFLNSEFIYQIYINEINVQILKSTIRQYPLGHLFQSLFSVLYEIFLCFKAGDFNGRC